MKSACLTTFLITILTVSCSKHTTSFRDKSFIKLGKDGITNFTNLTNSELPKGILPYMGSIGVHKYYFELRGHAPAQGQTHAPTVDITPNFTRVPKGNAGNIQVGNYLFEPQDDNRYGGFGMQQDGETDSTLLNCFGRTTHFRFEGVDGELLPFADTLRFPELLNITNEDQLEVKFISRNQGYTITFEKDTLNPYPLLLTLTWTEFMDQRNIYEHTFDHEYEIVTNKFLIPETGTIELKPMMFKDMPESASVVTVDLWRANALSDPQGIYFLVATNNGLGLNLTD